MKNNIARHRLVNISILGFLAASCVFFSVYDLLYEKIWWTTVSIYLPCLLVFLFGLDSWRELKVRNLLILGIGFVAIDLFLEIYGTILCLQGEWLWGLLTLGFSIFTIGLTWSIFVVWSRLKQSD